MKKAPTATNESGAFQSQHRLMQDRAELSANRQDCQTVHFVATQMPSHTGTANPWPRDSTLNQTCNSGPRPIP